MRGKIPQLKQALQGQLTEHHVFLLQSMLGHLNYLEQEIAAYSQRIEVCLRPFLTPEQTRQLDLIPGVNQRTIENVIAELGTDMSRFPDEEHLSSWAGMCPGNEESAGKRIRRRTTKGDTWLRCALTEAAWAAGHSKSYLGAQFRRIAARRGKKRALMAVGHTLLVIIYHMLKTGASYKDLGPDFFDELKPEQYRRYLVKRLESLGFNVELKPKDVAA